MFAQESVMDIQELGQFESVYKPSKEVAFCWLRKQYVQLSTEEDHTEIANHANDSLRIWQAAKAQAVPEGFVLVEKELSWVKADHLACAEWEKNKALFCTENRDIIALQIEEYRLRWCKNKAHKIMSEYKAMIEAQEPAND